MTRRRMAFGAVGLVLMLGLAPTVAASQPSCLTLSPIVLQILALFGIDPSLLDDFLCAPQSGSPPPNTTPEPTSTTTTTRGGGGGGGTTVPTPTTVPAVTTLPPPPPTTLAPAVLGTVVVRQPPAVLGEVITREPPAQPRVLGNLLARTGTNVVIMILAGAVLISIGVFLVTGARRRRAGHSTG